jgi:signal peptidase I
MARRRLLEKYNGRKLEWLHDSLFFIVMVACAVIIFRFVIGFSIVGGDSMEPNLHDREAVLYQRIVSEYRPGDVVSIRMPSGEYYVKRVIAVGGDEVDLREGRVFVNGKELDDKWAGTETLESQGAIVYPYKVREGRLFVLGDNRKVSMDSRTFGEVSRRQVRGRLILHMGRWYVKKVPK